MWKGLTSQWNMVSSNKNWMRIHHKKSQPKKSSSKKRRTTNNIAWLASKPEEIIWGETVDHFSVGQIKYMLIFHVNECKKKWTKSTTDMLHWDEQIWFWFFESVKITQSKLVKRILLLASLLWCAEKITFAKIHIWKYFKRGSDFDFVFSLYFLPNEFHPCYYQYSCVCELDWMGTKKMFEEIYI